MIRKWLAGLALLVAVTHAHAQVPVTTPDSGAVTSTGVVANSSHSAGTAVGGLMSVSISRQPAGGPGAGSGLVTNFMFTSPGGSTGQYVVRIWQKNPVNTTCTDNTAYAGSNSDDAFLITAPFSITPAAPAVTTGDAKTYFSQTGLSWDYRNQDQPPTTNLYVCVVTVSTDTADQATSIRVMMSGPQD